MEIHRTLTTLDFVDPDWTAALDPAPYLARVPAHETIKGMFLGPVAKAAAAKGYTLSAARGRYVPFQDYPLREHLANMVEAARVIFPEDSLRAGLRKLGRGALRVMMESTVGRVMWSTATDPLRALEAMVKAYAIVHPGCAVSVVDAKPGAVVIKADRVYGFLDCHHVGVFEGALHSVSAEPRIQVNMRSPIDGDLLCRY